MRFQREIYLSARLPIADKPLFFHSKKGFTLLELLIVIGMMSILTVFTTLSIVGNKQSGNANSAILTIGGFMDQCRQYAIANNTYVYVGLYQNPNPASSKEVWLAAVDSSDGTDISAGGQNSVAVGSSARPISKVIKLTGINLQSASLFTTAVNWTVPTGAVDISQSGTKTIGPLGSTNIQMPMAFAFAPDGTASTNGNVVTCLTFGIDISDASNGSHYVNPAVFQIAGLTGVTKIYRQ